MRSWLECGVRVHGKLKPGPELGQMRMKSWLASILGSDPEGCAQNLSRAKGEGKMEQQREMLW